jgi:hypothetical protein
VPEFPWALAMLQYDSRFQIFFHCQSGQFVGFQRKKIGLKSVANEERLLLPVGVEEGLNRKKLILESVPVSGILPAR